jgi:hypothetical protein
MKLLVLTSEPISAQGLRDAIPGELKLEDAEVMVVAPAQQQYREDIDADEIQQRFGLPVDHASVSGRSAS